MKSKMQVLDRDTEYLRCLLSVYPAVPMPFYDQHGDQWVEVKVQTHYGEVALSLTSKQLEMYNE